MNSISDTPKFDPSSLPSSAEIDRFVHDLSSTKLENVGYHVLYDYMSAFLKPFPVFISTLNVGTSIERARLNPKKGQPWGCEKDITFRGDSWNIKDYGRANTPQQSIFYGAIDTDETKNARVTLLHEIHASFRISPVNLGEVASMTVGKWITTNPLTFVDVIFHDEAISHSSRVRETYEHHEKVFKPILGSRYDDVMKVLKFISGQFAKTVSGDSSGYMISAAYFNFAVENGNGKIHGVTYPSVATNFHGANVALVPYAADKWLSLKVVAEVEISQTGPIDFLMDIPGVCQDLGILNSDFKWLDVEYGPSGLAIMKPRL